MWSVKSQDQSFSKTSHKKGRNSTAQKSRVESSGKFIRQSCSQKTSERKTSKKRSKQFVERYNDEKFEDYLSLNKKKTCQNDGILVTSCESCIRIYGDKKLTEQMCKKIKEQCALYHQNQLEIWAWWDKSPFLHSTLNFLVLM